MFQSGSVFLVMTNAVFIPPSFEIVAQYINYTELVRETWLKVLFFKISNWEKKLNKAAKFSLDSSVLLLNYLARFFSCFNCFSCGFREELHYILREEANFQSPQERQKEWEENCKTKRDQKIFFDRQTDRQIDRDRDTNKYYQMKFVTKQDESFVCICKFKKNV